MKNLYRLCPVIKRLSLILILLTTVLSACSGENAGNKASQTVNNGYTKEATELAIAQCMNSGTSQEICECVTSEIQAEVSAQEMQKLEADLLAGKGMTEEFAAKSTKAALKCVKDNRQSKSA